MTFTISDETAKTITDSWNQILTTPDAGAKVGELIYRNFFEASPGMWKMYSFGKKFDTLEDKMFKGRAFKLHAIKVFNSLDSTVKFVGKSSSDLSVLEETLKQLGAKHVSHGILPEHYPLIGHGLMKTLSTMLGDDFTPKLEQAWSAMYGFITRSMLNGSNESLLRVRFPVYGDKGKTASLDEYLSNMLPGQKDLFYITAKTSADSFNFNKLGKMQLAKDLQNEGVVIFHIAKNKRNLYANNLAKYLGCKMVDLEGDNVDISFLPQINEKYAGKKTAKSGRRESRKSRQNKDSRDPVASSGSHKLGEQDGNSIEMRTASSSPVSVVTSTNHHKPATGRAVKGLSEKQAAKFCLWFKKKVGKDRVVACTPTCKFASQPARINDASTNDDETRQFEEYNILQTPQANEGHHVEINPSHPLIVEIYNVAKRKNQKVAAKLLVENIYDGCLTNAGIPQDARSQVARTNGLVYALLQHVHDD